MSTLGDPLADLGLLMVYWADADDAFPPPSVARQVAAGSGFLTRAEMAEAYSSASGRDVSDLPFYVVLGYFKLAIIFEGIHRRHTLGQTVGEGFEGLGDEVPQLVDAGLASVRGML
jgi:aminoglycoside phosphotransferase (APT) family kinase protein